MALGVILGAVNEVFFASFFFRKNKILA